MNTTMLPATGTGAGTGVRARQGVTGSGGDLCGDILSEAYRPGVAPPVAVHIRPELRDHLVTQPSAIRSSTSLPLVVDDELPTSPGYEIRRAPPAVGRPH